MSTPSTDYLQREQRRYEAHAHTCSGPIMDEERLAAIEKHKWLSVDTRDLIAEVRRCWSEMAAHSASNPHLDTDAAAYDFVRSVIANNNPATSSDAFDLELCEDCGEPL
jgi:hypothetical protein